VELVFRVPLEALVKERDEKESMIDCSIDKQQNG
jgi:hypothetical protein